MACKHAWSKIQHAYAFYLQFVLSGFACTQLQNHVVANLFVLSILVCFIECNSKLEHECSCTFDLFQRRHESSFEWECSFFTIQWHSNDPDKVQCAHVLYHWLPRLINEDDYIVLVGMATGQSLDDSSLGRRHGNEEHHCKLSGDRNLPTS